MSVCKSLNSFCENPSINEFIQYFQDVKWDMVVKTVTSAFLTQAVQTALAINHGSVTVTLDGQDFFAMKVRPTFHSQEVNPLMICSL